MILHSAAAATSVKHVVLTLQCSHDQIPTLTFGVMAFFRSILMQSSKSS